MRTKKLILRNNIFQNGLTQRKLAQETGIPESVLSMIINGKYVPDNQQMTKIAIVIGKPVSEVFPEDSGG